MAPILTAADVLTSSEVAELVGIPQSTVEHYARTGRIPAHKVGGGKHWRYLRDELEAWVRGVRAMPSGKSASMADLPSN